MSYIFTPSGRVKTTRYIQELVAKRKEIIDAGKDTCQETSIPTLGDILADIEAFGLDITGEYINGWGVTDNYDADYPLRLKIDEDFCKREYELTPAGRDKLSAYLDKTAKKQKLCVEKALDVAYGTLIPLPDEVLCEVQDEYILGEKSYSFRQNIADDTVNPEFCDLIYGEDFIPCENSDIFTDKKYNVQYWDKIDDTIEDFLNQMVALSTKKINVNYYDSGVLPQVREFITEVLTECGGCYPYVDGCF